MYEVVDALGWVIVLKCLQGVTPVARNLEASPGYTQVLPRHTARSGCSISLQKGFADLESLPRESCEVPRAEFPGRCVGERVKGLGGVQEGRPERAAGRDALQICVPDASTDAIEGTHLIHNPETDVIQGPQHVESWINWSRCRSGGMVPNRQPWRVSQGAADAHLCLDIVICHCS